MQKCSYCGADLQENSRFCGQCGSRQDVIATDASATMNSNTLQPQSWAPNLQVPAPPPPATENEDERRRGIPPWSPLYSATLGADALLSSGSAYPPTPGAPVVQGTPQFGSVPSVAGSPTPYSNAPIGNPSLGPASTGHPTLGSASAPISHPVQGPGNSPISHPIQGPPPIHHPSQPIHHPTQPPATQDHDPTHKHHEHRTHHMQHTASHMTKVAGGSTIKTIIIVVTAAVVVAAGGIGTATYFLLRQQPLISITSNYQVGNTPAGATGTILHISGQKFSSNSAITFLLDNHAAPGNPGTRSDSNGNFSTDVTITHAWSVGTHTLTARDASNNNTKNSVSVTIVQPGQANTPGQTSTPTALCSTPPGTNYFDDFSKYSTGQPPSGYILRGASGVSPTIEEIGGTGAAYRLLDFPSVSNQYWDRWVLKTGLTLCTSYIVTAKLNFQTSGDRAGLAIAWNDTNLDRIDIQPNIYFQNIEFRITYTGPNPSSPSVTGPGLSHYSLPMNIGSDYWLRVVATSPQPGQGHVIVYWSTDGTNFTPVVIATGLANLTGLVGMSTSGPNLPNVYFDDFQAIEN